MTALKKLTKTLLYMFITFIAMSFLIAQSVYAAKKKAAESAFQNTSLPAFNTEQLEMDEAQQKGLEAYQIGRAAYLGFLSEYSEVPYMVKIQSAATGKPHSKKSEFFPYKCMVTKNLSNYEISIIAKEQLGYWKEVGNINKWQLPILTNELLATIQQSYKLNVFLDLLKPYYDYVSFDAEDQLIELLSMYAAHADKIENKTYLTFIDMRLHSAKKRFFKFKIRDFKKGLIELEASHTSHGKGSDPNIKKATMGTGIASDFGNTEPEESSAKTSIGFYLATSDYCSRGHGVSLKLYGLSPTNHRAYDREVIIHGADYINDGIILAYERVGRSFGCPALEPSVAKHTIQQLKGGSLIYLYGEDTADFDPMK